MNERPLIVWVQSIYSDTGVMEDYSFRYSVTFDGDIIDRNTGELVKYTVPKHYPYKTVCLYDQDGNKHERLVHRIVATTFQDVCGEINEVVNHLDENKMNNQASNLRWTTQLDNWSYGTAKERAKLNQKKAMEKRKQEKEALQQRPVLISLE